MPAASAEGAAGARLGFGGRPAARGGHAPHQRLQRRRDLGRAHVGLEAGVGAAMQAQDAVFGGVEIGDGDDAGGGIHGSQAGHGHAEIGEFGFHHQQGGAARLEQAEQAVGVFAGARREAHSGQRAATALALTGIGREDDQVEEVIHESL
ncbi:hypothetical protein WJ976_06685 [Achromobacter denitrificans]